VSSTETWDAQWRSEPLDAAAIDLEKRTPRWRAQARLVEGCFDGFRGLSVIEIGAGRGLNGLLYAARGADVTLLDTSSLALDQARLLSEAQSTPVTTVVADALDLPPDLRERFDIAMSFGLCEHFVGSERRAIVAAHLELLRPGGIAFLGVPNRWAPFYRLWMAVLKRRGTWPLGVEEPFAMRELRQLVHDAGGEPLAPSYGSFVASVVSHGVNQALYKVGRKGVRIPQWRVPALDRLAYELLVPACRTAEEAT
jgi:SAM-dependent methyltransferase